MHAKFNNYLLYRYVLLTAETIKGSVITALTGLSIFVINKATIVLKKIVSRKLSCLRSRK